MKTTERYLWIAGLILAGFVIQNQMTTIDAGQSGSENLKTLLATYEAESKIQDAQINDFNTQLTVVRDTSYSQGFEDGRTQAGVALVNGNSLYSYADGYHAALTQAVDDEAVLEVSQGILTELESLRKMVPRLLKENEYLKSGASEKYLLDLVLDLLEEEENVESSYLEILDLLSDIK